MPESLSSYSESIASLIAKAALGVVAVNGRHRLPSSGLAWRPGILVTADHSLKRDEEITVTLPDNREVPAELAGRDPGTDLAVLKIDSSANLPLPTRATLPPQPGHLVFAVARRIQNGVNAGMGILNAVSGSWRTWRGGQIDQFIRPDIDVYPGTSGGALIDATGATLGLVTAALTRGVAIAIPNSTVDRVCDELLKRGRIARGYLGVGLHPVHLPTHGRGVIVLSVEPAGAAAEAGIYVGDVIVKIEGSPVHNTDDVQAHLAGGSVGKPLTLSLVRGNSPIDVQAVPRER